MTKPTIRQIIWLFIWLWFGLLVLSADGQELEGIGGFNRGIRQTPMTKEQIVSYMDLLKSANVDIAQVAIAAIAQVELHDISLMLLEKDYAKVVEQLDVYKEMATRAELYFRLLIIVSIFLVLVTAALISKGRIVMALGGVYILKNKKDTNG